MLRFGGRPDTLNAAYFQIPAKTVIYGMESGVMYLKYMRQRWVILGAFDGFKSCLAIGTLIFEFSKQNFVPKIIMTFAKQTYVCFTVICPKCMTRPFVVHFS